jgi:hypothetical protein
VADGIRTRVADAVREKVGDGGACVALSILLLLVRHTLGRESWTRRRRGCHDAKALDQHIPHAGWRDAGARRAKEDPTGGFTHGGWSVKYWDETMLERIAESMSRPFDLLLGRKTYEIFAAHWPHVGNDPADALSRATKYVASRSLTSVQWEKSRLLRGDLTEAVAH